MHHKHFKFQFFYLKIMFIVMIMYILIPIIMGSSADLPVGNKIKNE